MPKHLARQVHKTCSFMYPTTNTNSFIQKLNFHLDQLKIEYPVDDKKFQEWRNLDIARHSETKKELEEIKQKQRVR